MLGSNNDTHSHLFTFNLFFFHLGKSPHFRDLFFLHYVLRCSTKLMLTSRKFRGVGGRFLFYQIVGDGGFFFFMTGAVKVEQMVKFSMPIQCFTHP